MTHQANTTIAATTQTNECAPDGQATRRPAARSDVPVKLPRRQRIGSALGSVLVTTVLIGSVVVGMGWMADDAMQVASQPAPTQRA